MSEQEEDLDKLVYNSDFAMRQAQRWEIHMLKEKLALAETEIRLLNEALNTVKETNRQLAKGNIS